ncbi:MAG TPA: efflux RND transporter periplasmic adaptor subunit [Chitinophagaceae bacterium]|nr:efflux RND transporter periplasmic adaptor subunit [Chitinophagaceae bacterium]
MRILSALRNYSFVLALAILAAACGAKSKKDTAPRPAAGNRQQMVMNVDAYIVKTEPFAVNIEVPGSVIANETTEIHPEVSGRVVQLKVAEGRYVSKGALLAKLYDADLQAQLKKLQVQLQIAKTNEERSGQLLKIEGISKADYDASLLNVNNIKADIDIIRTDISRTEIRAPFSGILGLKNISPGAYVTPTTIIAVINQTNQLKLDFTVPEKYTRQIKIGQIVHFSYEGSDKKYAAKIVATESSVAENTRSLKVRSIVQAKDDKLLPGAFAKVQLAFDPNPNTILIPTQAVLPQARGKKAVLYNNGIAKFTDVTTGIRDSARVQILEGLKAGDTVLVTGLLSVRPEGKVKINKIVGPL